MIGSGFLDSGSLVGSGFQNKVGCGSDLKNMVGSGLLYLIENEFSRNKKKHYLAFYKRRGPQMANIKVL